MKNIVRRFWLIVVLVCCMVLPNGLALSAETDADNEILAGIKKFTGDFDGMVERTVVRVLIPHDRAFYFFDGVQQRGISYEAAMLFEKFINKKLKTKTVKVDVLVVPTPRDKLFSRLVEGVGDIAIGNLTITDERRKIVDFSNPFAKNVSEILVTHRQQESPGTVFDLSGMEIHVRQSSSYYESLVNLNSVLERGGKKPVRIILADENLEDSDLLEMVGVGVMPAVIVDKHKGELWAEVFDNIKLHPEIAVRSGGNIAWAMRKDSPKLMAIVNEFAKDHRAGTMLGNVILKRYLKNTKYIANSVQGEEARKFERSVKFFKTYGDQYDLDHLMLAALAYQESRLDQKLRSPVGAVGVMQILPSTAKDKNIGITGVEKLEPNIHAGTKYIRFLADRYFPEDENLSELNSVLFTFASYNAGPARVADLRKEAAAMGLDANVWFDNVEVVAAKRIGRETVQYVRNILKYYVAYKLLSDTVHEPNESK